MNSIGSLKQLEMTLHSLLGWLRAELNFVAIQWFNRVQLFAVPWTAACQASCPSLSRSLLKLMSMESVTPSNHVILCHPLLLLPSIFPSV